MSKWKQSIYLLTAVLCLSTNLAADEEEIEWQEECVVDTAQQCNKPTCPHHGRGCNYRSDFYHACGIWATCEDDCVRAHHLGAKGVWLPEGAPLYRPYIADPRQITYSVGWRFNDQALAKNIIPVSFADIIPIYRWCCVSPLGGQLEIGIEGGVWAVFDPITYSAPLINADYYVGFPIDYAIDCWAFRLRGYHISSHIGDEFLLNHPAFDRRNPSAEYVDFSVSNQFSRDIRLFGGVGYIVQYDESYPFARFYANAGAELRFLELGFASVVQQMYGTPFFALFWRYSSDFKHHVDITYSMGYEIGKLCGQGRKVRIQADYHDGYSVEGQFSTRPTNYFQIKATYGY